MILGALSLLVPRPTVAITEDGQYAAAGRANQVFLYHVPSHRELGRLTDPAVLKSGVYSQPGVAHLDLVQAVAFSPNGELLATGGFRTAKIWRRAAGKIEGAQPADFAAAVKSMAMSGDGKVAVFGLEDKSALVVELASGKTLHTLSGHEGPVTAVAISADGAAIEEVFDSRRVRQLKKSPSHGLHAALLSLADERLRVSQGRSCYPSECPSLPRRSTTVASA